MNSENVAQPDGSLLDGDGRAAVVDDLNPGAMDGSGDGVQLTAHLAPSRPFRYGGRWASRVLLMLLATSGLLSLINMLWGIVAVTSPATHESFIIFHQLALLGWFAVLFLEFIFFLVWIVLVHRDLKGSLSSYPISPLGALARITIPVVSLWGYFNVFFTLGEELAVNLRALTVISFGLVFAQKLVSAGDFQLESPVMLLFFAVQVALAAVWFVMASRIHRAMAAMEERALAGAGEIGEVTPAASVTTTPGATAEAFAGETAPAPVAVQPARRGMGRTLKISLVLISLFACGIFAIGALYGPRVIEGMIAFDEEWYDESYDHLMGVLWDRWGPDDSIPSASANFEYRDDSDSPSEIWLVIDLETTVPCTINKPGDPCQALADEFGRIVLENYPKVDQLDGLQVSVTHYISAGAIELSHGVDVIESIPEWRSKLRIVKGAEDA